MVLLKICMSIFAIFLGIAIIIDAIQFKKLNCPKCIYISQFISGIAISICSFIFWFIN